MVEDAKISNDSHTSSQAHLALASFLHYSQPQSSRRQYNPGACNLIKEKKKKTCTSIWVAAHERPVKINGHMLIFE